jgi:glyceraldehyde-3-phosphate dehydrogenase/erythrose-4-phosphate dehydrogenase
MIKVGINGFGRIGRFVFRAAQNRSDIQIVGINDLCPVDYLAYMLKYDTMHGAFEGTIEADVENSKLIVNGKAIRVTAERNPADLKWNENTRKSLPSATPYGRRRAVRPQMSHLRKVYRNVSVYPHPLLETGSLLS